MQYGGSDCGLFAVAFATALALQHNPEHYHFVQDKLRRLVIYSGVFRMEKLQCFHTIVPERRDVLRRRMRTCVLSVSSMIHGLSIPALRLGTLVPRQKMNIALEYIALAGYQNPEI